MSAVPAVIRARWAQVVMVAAPLLVLLAVIAVSRRAPEGETLTVGGAFLPELRERAAEIVRVEVERGDESVVLALGQGGWELPKSDGYPARIERVQEIVRSMAALRREQPMTELPTRHGDLGLAWPDPAGEATLVRLFVAGAEAPITEVVLGRDRFSPRTQYVRRLGEAQTWRVGGSVTAPAVAVQFVSDRLSDLPARDVERIAFPGGIIERNEEGEWSARADAPAPLVVELSDVQRADAEFALPELLARLDFDLMRRDDGPAARDEFRHESIGGTVVLELFDESDGIWMRLRWHATDNGDADAERAGEIVDRMEPYVQRWDGWLYRLPPWRSQRIRNAAGWTLSDDPADPQAPVERPTLDTDWTTP